ncbi:CHASE2 domain-containing protein [Rhodoferax aquaticus]|uniref:CHASE2 domain-containing protein n=1 Tax=Rhodoferax aquaticus TaxID=2527691 RepID=A0A515EJJ3_9BURK|nr:CHASE2 domain-containing protein [Rhodoferax aquaticus]QDL52759.1 CHASE2 domain-containing protein [Rhodoferax aquaticus]
MHLWDRFSEAIGALPARRVTWGLVLVFALWVLLDVLVLKFTGGLTQSTYDAMVRARVLAPAPDPRIVVVDIDEASLARMGKEFGRWPWPRDTLATVLEHIERQQPAAVVWDVLFSDADRLSPGGDAAFNEAAKRSVHSHFSVVRLPQSNDADSQIGKVALPSLWLAPHLQALLAEPRSAPQPSLPAATVALIPPGLPAVANGRLGYNNGYVDDDGVLRRYRYFERLSDGSAIQSLPLSVLSAIDSEAAGAYLVGASERIGGKDDLIVWPKRANAYPHLAFADVFMQAEGEPPWVPVPSLAGKVVIIGATAPSLHDIHPTPLSNMHAGVDALAVVVDNAMNQRQLRELPRGLQAALAIALCVALALWVQFKSAASLAPALLALPAALLGVSYLSLNGSPVFVDLHLSAALGLVFLAVLRFWSALRRVHWCLPPQGDVLAVWPLRRDAAWLEEPLDRLIDAVERHAPECRVLVCDSNVVWPATLRWPELARFAAVVGPPDALQRALPALTRQTQRLVQQAGPLSLLPMVPVHAGGEAALLAGRRLQLAQYAYQTWATFGALAPQAHAVPAPSTHNNPGKTT